MGVARYYWIVDPPRGGINDDGSRQPAIVQDIVGVKGEKLQLVLHCDTSGEPHFFCVRVFDVDDVADINRVSELLTTVKEHLLSVLRLTWKTSASVVPLQIYMMEPEPSTGANMKIDWPTESPFTPSHAKDMFVHAFPLRQSLRLLTDGMSEQIPIQYRFLSLYKILEIRFMQPDEQWDSQALMAAAANQLHAFATLGLPRSLERELKRLRDRCAHIQTGRHKRRILGVTALNHGALLEVERVLPVLRDICRDIVNRESVGKFILGDLRPWYEKAQERLQATQGRDDGTK
jgi:hypothetical protein